MPNLDTPNFDHSNQPWFLQFLPCSSSISGRRRISGIGDSSSLADSRSSRVSAAAASLHSASSLLPPRAASLHGSTLPPGPDRILHLFVPAAASAPTPASSGAHHLVSSTAGCGLPSSSVVDPECQKFLEEECIEVPSYIHIETNEFSYRKHKKQKEEDIAVCECQYDILDPESPCGDRCLNFLTNTECTPGYCRCGVYCKNQRFQKCQHARTRLVRTQGRGWGLVADENIMAGQFVIEYCGEVISWKEAKQRSQAYETQGMNDAYIIYLNADESIDATKKGSLARFINHSCQPNCETRKWNVLGEVRVGIFATQDIPFGTELSYDYNFEWFGGVMVRCLCGAANCSGFLGAKSRGFQEATYLWEDDDDRFSVENIPLYDSADDEPTSISKDILLSNDGLITQYDNSSTVQSTENPGTARPNDFAPMIVEQMTSRSNELAPMNVEPLAASSNEFTPMTIEPLNAIPMVAHFVKNGSTEYSAQDTYDTSQNSVPSAANHVNQTESQNNSNHSALVPVKPAPKRRGRKPKRVLHKLDIPDICNRLASSEACEEILYCEEVKNQAASEINALYDEIRPAVEEHERDSQDSVSTSLAEKWIESSCCKYKADFDLYAAIIKNIASTPLRPKDDMASREQNGLKYLENVS